MKFEIALPNDVQEIMSVIREYGATSYVVGGCVRDSILGREPHDWDICTPALACELLVCFEEKGYRVIPTGLQHGTITVHLNGNNYEITTFRRDGKYTDGRHPDNVEFTSNLIYDLERRDFTINAMAYNPEERLIDPFNGLDDIKHKIVRCVEDSQDRFAEDSLRILRAIRLAFQLGFDIDSRTECAMFSIPGFVQLKDLSIERFTSEFIKIINARHFNWLMFYSYYRIFAQHIPEIYDMYDCEQKNPYHWLDVYQHTCAVLLGCTKQNADLVTKLAAFFHDIGKPHCYQDDENGVRHFKGHGKVSADMTDVIMRRLKFDNDTREKVVQLVYYHDASFEVGKKYVRRWLNKMGVDQFKRLLVLRRADIMGQSELNRDERLQKLDSVKVCLEEVLKEKPAFSVKDLEIDGKDVMKYMLMDECPEVGYWMKHILKQVIDGHLQNNREDLIYYMIGVTDGRLKP